MSGAPAYRLRLPGPTQVPARVLQAMARPVLAHRGPEFTAVMRETTPMARTVFGTANRVLLFASTGTGLMEAALANVLSPGERALILVNGMFSARFAQIAAALGLAADTLQVPWGEAVGADAVEEKLKQRDYRAVVAVHNETSTGAVADLEAIGRVVRATPALLVVDSVSGVGGMDMRQDAWGADIVITAAQKALMCPPGLALASIGDKAWPVIERDGKPRFYFDFRRAREFDAGKGQTAFTSPVSLVFALREALAMIHEEGWERVLARHASVSAALRAGAARLGFTLFPSSPLVSNTVCVLKPPEGLDAKALAARLHEGYGTVIIATKTDKGERVLRIGTMGACTQADVATDLEHLEGAMADLGWRGGE